MKFKSILIAGALTVVLGATGCATARPTTSAFRPSGQNQQAQNTTGTRSAGSGAQNSQRSQNSGTGQRATTNRSVGRTATQTPYQFRANGSYQQPIGRGSTFGYNIVNTPAIVRGHRAAATPAVRSAQKHTTAAHTTRSAQKHTTAAHTTRSAQKHTTAAHTTRSAQKKHTTAAHTTRSAQKHATPAKVGHTAARSTQTATATHGAAVTPRNNDRNMTGQTRANLSATGAGSTRSSATATRSHTNRVARTHASGTQVSNYNPNMHTRNTGTSNYYNYTRSQANRAPRTHSMGTGAHTRNIGTRGSSARNMHTRNTRSTHTTRSANNRAAGIANNMPGMRSARNHNYGVNHINGYNTAVRTNRSADDVRSTTRGTTRSNATRNVTRNHAARGYRSIGQSGFHNGLVPYGYYVNGQLVFNPMMYTLNVANYDETTTTGIYIPGMGIVDYDHNYAFLGMDTAPTRSRTNRTRSHTVRNRSHNTAETRNSNRRARNTTGNTTRNTARASVDLSNVNGESVIDKNSLGT